MMLHAAERLTSGPGSHTGPHFEPRDGDARGPNAPRTSLGPIKEIVVTLVAPFEQPTLERTVTELAEHTAFDLAELRPSPDGLMGQWHARFRLRAPRGIVGDAQIYDLLRYFAGELRWVEISKEPGYEIPAHLADLAGGERPLGN